MNRIFSTGLFRLLYRLRFQVLLRACLRHFAGNPPIVLFCHRVLPPKSGFSRLDVFYHALGHPTVEQFREQMAYLRRFHSFVAIEDVIDYMRGDKILPPNSVSVTFDDGYGDNHVHALPILKEVRGKGTFFVSTDFIGTGNVPPQDRLIYALCYTNRETLNCKIGEGETVRYPLTTMRERIRAFLALQERLKFLEPGRRQEFVDEIADQLDVDLSDVFPEEFMLTWERARAMRAEGHSVYCHTRGHPCLTSIGPEDLQREIAGAKRIIEEALSTECDVFCYPYGLIGDFSPDIVRFLAENRFQAACSAIHGINRSGDDLFNIRRTALIAEPLESFALRVSGLLEILYPFISFLKRESHGPMTMEYGLKGNAFTK